MGRPAKVDHNAEYIKDYYHVPFKKGRRVVMGKKSGVITGTINQYVAIKFDETKNSVPCHPTDFVYMNTEGEVIKY